MTSIVKFQPTPATKFFTNSFFEDFFNRGLNDFVGMDASLSVPAVNVADKGDHFQVEIAAPGFDKEQFTLHVENGYLTIKAQKEEKTEDKNQNEGKVLRREFRFESFERSFKLPNTVNQDAINGVYLNGILQVTLPKKEDAKPLAKTIKIA